MKTYRISSIAALLLGFVASAQAGESGDPSLTAAIRQQAAQAQTSIRSTATAELHRIARQHFTAWPVRAPALAALESNSAAKQQL